MVLIHASFVHASSGPGETGPIAHARLIRRYSHAMNTSSCVLLSLRFVPLEPLSARQGNTIRMAFRLAGRFYVLTGF